MTPENLETKNISLLKDEEYFIYMAKKEADNIFDAKSWLIVAQTIYPQNFDILFEIYKIAKQEKNIREAAKCLGIMFEKFRHEPLFWIEVDAIMDLLCQQTSNVSHSLLTQIFYSLSKDIQKGLINFAADKSKDTITYCSKMLLLISTFPEATAYNGLKLIDALMKAEKPNDGPLNPYRRKLVCELLPRLLQSEGFEVRPKTLHNLLTKSIEFYISYAITPNKVTLDQDDIIDPWQDLFTIVRLIGWNLGWELATEFDVISNRELILQKIQNMVQGGAKLGGGSKGDNSEDVREVFFTTVTLFLHALLDYTRRLNPDFNKGESISTFTPSLTLIEAFTKVERLDMKLSHKPLLSPTSKRLRPSFDEEQTSAFITISSFSGSSPSSLDPLGSSPTNTLSLVGSPHPQSNISSGSLSQALSTAIKCWDLLHSYETLRSEFVRLLEGLNLDRCLIVFNLDVLIYEGRLADAEMQLRHALSRAAQSNIESPSNHITTLTLNLKLASVLFFLNKFSAATEAALEVVGQLGPLSIQGGLTHNLVVLTTPLRRHLHFLALTRSQCLQYITTLLIHSLRHLIIEEGSRDDLCIGHLLILLQYEWPRYDNIFEEIVSIIQKKGGFAYQYFAPYVTIPDMLEQFMFMSSSLGGGLQLDILPLPHSTKQQRMSTRGADRGSKQDFKSAMNKQMLRCHESVEANIVAFLQIQGPYIPHVFM